MSKWVDIPQEGGVTQQVFLGQWPKHLSHKANSQQQSKGNTHLSFKQTSGPPMVLSSTKGWRETRGKRDKKAWFVLSILWDRVGQGGRHSHSDGLTSPGTLGDVDREDEIILSGRR